VASADQRAARRERVALGILFGIALVQRLWNVVTVEPLTGFDAPGHMGYVLTILQEHRLPQPYEGWSTFHPPLYYLVAAGVWRVLEPLGPRAVLFGIRGLGVVFGLVAALVAHRLVRRLGAGRDVAFVATALMLFVPCIQMSATMEGNETFAAGILALGLPSLLTLQGDPRNLRAALMAGLFAGLAAISKFTGLALIAACAVPFLRRDFDAAMVRALLALGFVFALVAGPLYGRNVLAVGTPFPMTRTREPMHTAEQVQIIRPRQVLDYVTLHVDNFRRPSVFHIPRWPGLYRNRNLAMTSVPGLLYASFWYDPFAHRIPVNYHRDGIRSGPTMLALGLVPTLLMLAGLVVAMWRSVAQRLRAAEAPFVALGLAGGAMLVVHTWTAQSTASVKGTYLLQLAPAAAVFFAQGATLLPDRVRTLALALSLAAVGAATFVFTEGALFWSVPPGVGTWLGWARTLPGSHIEDAIRWFYVMGVSAG
jgi:4-amino-4-deoxy-L-arabinose transferase-like glycosyltransferase